MEDVINLINEQAILAGINIGAISVTTYNPHSFGDFSVNADIDGTRIKIIRDGGQYFIDIYDENAGGYVPANRMLPSAVIVYEKTKWNLWELFLVLSN